MLLILVLGACRTKPPPAAPADVRTVISASSDVNPDLSGRASPVVVRIYQLRGDAEFNGADFFALYEKEKETLGASLIVRDERTVFPGQQVQLMLALAPETRFVGAAAAFRDIAGTRWHALIPATRSTLVKHPVTIKVEKAAIRLSAGG
jgi:type VI secretion system protein VasD